VFDEMLDIQEIVECASDISKYYDDLIGWNIDYKHHRNNAGLMDIEYDHKKALWLALMSVNILEGIRFYVSFACSWAFAEMKKMEGNAKIIKLICRDENLHLAGTQQLLKVLPKDDEDFAKIKEETKSDCVQMYINAANQEKIWSEYLFKDGSMIGLNAKLLSDYVEWITNRRLVSVDLPTQFKTGSNPLPWTQKWISGGDVQVAPQETQISSYVSGGVAMDVNNDTLKTLSL
jgi:ribonucleoside-diphosphate reductase beta chain